MANKTTKTTLEIIDAINTSSYTMKDLASKYDVTLHRISQIKKTYASKITGTTIKPVLVRRLPSPLVERPVDALPMTYVKLSGEVLDTTGYIATPDGRIFKEHDSGLVRECHQSINSAGYLQFGFGKIALPVHRCIACTFVPTEDYTMHADHDDGDRLNCASSNMKWLTVRENNAKRKRRRRK